MKNLFKIITVFMLCFSLFAGCTSSLNKVDAPVTETVKDENEEYIEAILSQMTLAEKIYQMMFVTPEVITKKSNVTDAVSKETLEKYSVGGIIYFSPNFTSRTQTENMIDATQKNSKIPLFIGVDEEGGRVSRLGSNPNMEFPKISTMKKIGKTGDAKEAYKVGALLGDELKKLGFNVDFAPVSDVIIREDNTEIGNRSFGTDANKVADMVEQFVIGMEKTGTLSVLKHFPGHGSTHVNSHNGYSESTRTLNELRSTEFVPFKKGIDAGASFVLVSHMTLVNATNKKMPSTLSKEVITDFLLGELGFGGIVITDSMSMGAITTEFSQGEAIVKSIQAGADMCLMPNNIDTAFGAIKKAIDDGTLTEERIEKSVRKILKMKVNKGIILR